MASLRESDAAMVCSHWDMQRLESLASIRNIITTFPSIGVYKRGPSEAEQCTKNLSVSLEEGKEETLVSWTLLFRLGWIGSTYTLPQHRRRGLACAATQALALRLQFEGLMPYVLIGDDNEQSIELHEGLGFRKQCAINMVMVEPKH